VELTNRFVVDVPVEQAWSVLTDLERIAPCMPGAELQEVGGAEYRGVVKVKVGPITAHYKGKATFVEQDVATRRVVLRAEGRETRGQGGATAIITAILEPAGEVTRVSVVTDLTVTGRAAQFGQGVMADVSNKLIGQFVDSLESTVLVGPTADQEGPRIAEPGREGGDVGAEPARAPGARSGTDRQLRQGAEPVDLLEVAVPSLLKRAAPLVAALTAIAVTAMCLARRKSRRCST
jgi:carbon monoxide dehydrogenase subunit G